MARPPVEWPIPVYVMELRRRLVVCFRVPASALATQVAGPLSLEPPRGAGGLGIAALALGMGRCLKPAGGTCLLAGEYQVAELFTPAVWRPACREALRGSCLLGAWTDCHGLGRLAATALEFPVSPLGGPGAPPADLAGLFPGQPAPFPTGSLYPTAEAADGLLRPERVFAPAAAAVWAPPVHFYYRSAEPVTLAPEAALTCRRVVADRLGLHPERVVPDHARLQRRCTHTWSFPPERIPAAPRRDAGQAPGLRSAA